jgi:hypothetical protein
MSYCSDGGLSLSVTIMGGDVRALVGCPGGQRSHQAFAAGQRAAVSAHNDAGIQQRSRAGVKKVWGPGRHLVGNNTFSYFIDPSGNTMEYTTELATLDEDSWHPHVYDVADPLTQDRWGTADPMSELIAKESFNDIDRGLFVPPPV